MVERSETVIRERVRSLELPLSSSPERWDRRFPRFGKKSHRRGRLQYGEFEVEPARLHGPIA